MRGQTGDASWQQRADSAFTVAPPSIALPKWGCDPSIGEKFTANPVTGTGPMTVALATSPGRSGMGPQLELNYDSGAANGPFGFGWLLSLPRIARKTDRGLPERDADGSDVFILSGAEDLMPEFNLDGPRFEDIDTAGYRTEGLFTRVERWTRHRDSDGHRRSISQDNILIIGGALAEPAFLSENPVDKSTI